MNLAQIPRYPLVCPHIHIRTYTSNHCNYGLILIQPLMNATIQLHTYTPARLLPYTAFRFPPFLVFFVPPARVSRFRYRA